MIDQRLTKCAASAGTGKTYTLAAYYIALLLSGKNYRNILAVTFTNKATAEMKERILTYLYGIAIAPEDEDIQSFMQAVCREMDGLKLSVPDDIPQRAMVLYREILGDYDNMRVTTIDSFLQTLLTGMAQALGIAAGFSVDLDLEHIISEAVEQVLTTHVLDQEGLLDAVEAYLNERMHDEKSWDIQPSLKAIAQEMFKENVQASEEQIVYSKPSIDAFKKVLHQRFEEEKNRLEDVLSVLREIEWDQLRDGNVRNDLLSMMPRLDGTTDKKNDLYRGYGLRVEKKLVDFATFAAIYSGSNAQAVYEALVCVNDVAAACKKAYLYKELTSEYLYDIMLLSYIRHQIQSNLRDNNSMLLADTANLLARAIQPGDADFILEKAGIRYSHIILDEFQDTSRLQWQNFLPLIIELLGRGGTSFIVGDTKQSIYRWRNGDWDIMNSLNTEHPQLGSYFRSKLLQRNFRSEKAVVQFVIDTFDQLLQQEGEREQRDEVMQTIYADIRKQEDFAIDHFFAPKHSHGFVRLRAYPYINKDKKNPEASEPWLRDKVRHRLLDDMFATIRERLAAGDRPKDCLILVRKGAEANEVIASFREQGMTDVRMVSADSFVLEASSSVQIVIAALRYLYYRQTQQQDLVANHYLALMTGTDYREALDALDLSMPLSELMEQVIRLCLCKDGRADIEDVAYLNNLKDRMRDFVGSYGSDLKQWLQYWDDSLHKQAIPPSSSDAIQVMTIHASKGLEAKNVFIPFCNWKMEEDKGKLWCEVEGLNEQQSAIVPIRHVSQMKEAGYEDEYLSEHRKLRIDNMNLLYVALTRAAQRLYVSWDCPSKDGVQDDVGYLLMNRWGMTEDMLSAFASREEEKKCWTEVTFGEEDWTENSTTASHQTTKDLKPFDFKVDADHTIPASVYSEEQTIAFRQSQESQQYAFYGEVEGEQRIQQRAFGTICHDVLSKVRCRGEEEKVIAAFYQSGIIEDETMREEVQKMIDRMWSNEQLCGWFDGSWELMQEESFLIPHHDHVEERRMDRVMIRGKKAIVLDYKFGEQESGKHRKQVGQYMAILRGMGYQQVEGYLWYGKEEKLVEVK